ncbi:MAG: type II secretion system protein [Sulfurovum sp.]|nr:type II secretion system protein [Sulfurovum sp.]
MKYTKHRKAFSMLTAIFVIVIMAGIGALVMSLSGKMVKETTTQFQREQAMLLAKSYTEYAIMAVMSNDRNGTNSCLETINSDNVIRSENNGGFEVRVQIAYISNGSGELTSCSGTRIFSDASTTAESPLNIIVDVYVKYKDFDHHAYDGDFDDVPYITYHKRTLQKI